MSTRALFMALAFGACVLPAAVADAKAAPTPVYTFQVTTGGQRVDYNADLEHDVPIAMPAGRWQCTRRKLLVGPHEIMGMISCSADAWQTWSSVVAGCSLAGPTSDSSKGALNDGPQLTLLAVACSRP